MNIIYAVSEVAPFAKTGGLADVAASLSAALAGLGHRVCLIMPMYACVRDVGARIETTGVKLDVPLRDRTVPAEIFKSALPGADVPVYFVKNDLYFDRGELYGNERGDYLDNAERFIFFDRAVLEAASALELNPDIIHCNDWQAGLIPLYLKTLYKDAPGLTGTRSVFTIHNLAYQGLFWHWDMPLTGLPWEYFNYRQLEFYGKVSFLKGGIVNADRLTTVSKTYAREIQTPELGCGLDELLASRRAALTGIVNGIDYSVWDPAVDGCLPQTYSPDNLDGKIACKTALQREAGFDVVPKAPVVAMISRLNGQKGLDLALKVMPEFARRGVQFVVLGVGAPRYTDAVLEQTQAFPTRIKAALTFDEALAHRIQAGADMVMMPSRYEPCGLTQLYALKYGTVPVVRNTGGLADTVIDYTEASTRTGSATGFKFERFRSEELADALDRACKVYAHPEKWRNLMATGMKQDWSWARSAGEYVELYEAATANIEH